MATVELTKTDRARSLRYRKAAELLERWLSEESDYDEEVGAMLELALPSNGMRCGESVADPA